MADSETKVEEFDLEASTERWRWAGLILLFMFLLAFPIYRIYEPAQRAEARESQIESLGNWGEGLYEDSCASCHGSSGSGAIAPAIGAKEFLESAEDIQINQLIAIGVPGTEMVAYSNDAGGPLSPQEVTAITTYLRSLEEDAISKPNWRTPLEDEDLTANELFLLACTRCHGVDAEGIEDTAPDISQDSMTLMESDAWLIGRITDGYKLMPRFGRILTAEQIAGLVTYMRHGDNPPPDTTTTTTAAPTTTVPGMPPTGGDATTTTATNNLALGQTVFEETAGGVGCADCHGLDAKGLTEGDTIGPDIVGASMFSITESLGRTTEMLDIKLTSEELQAVYEYLQFLWSQQ